MVSWRNRFLVLFDRMPLPLALCGADGGIGLANPAMGAEFGRTAGQLVGRNILEFFRPQASAQLDRITEALHLGRRSRYPLAVRWTADGAVCEGEGELMVDPVSEDTGGPPGLLVMLRRTDAARADADGPPAHRPPEVGPMAGRILALAAAGHTTAAIARTVGLTVDGVTYHLTQLSRRWRAPNRAALVARAYALGVLVPGRWPPVPAGDEDPPPTEGGTG
ncbi:PAS domain-containing protein [Streptomyces sp. bgisy100]|uniref:PAS domain-containing protein n=1 Tax=Streptomyces sp. bgisy100 TaxID=3413783 RepID=UPI003D747C68